MISLDYLMFLSPVCYLFYKFNLLQYFTIYNLISVFVPFILIRTCIRTFLAICHVLEINDGDTP